MHIQKKIPVIIISTILGYVMYSYLYYSQLGEFPGYSENRLIPVFVFLGSNFIGFFISWLNNKIAQIKFWREKTGFRFITALFVNYAIIIIIVYGCTFLYLTLSGSNLTLNSLIREYPEIKARVYILTLVLDILIIVFNFLIYSYRHYSYGQIQTEKVKRKQIELQFEALKTQLSPHYLFNSLNTISSLMYKDAGLTESYIRKLVNTYQYILQSDKKQLITLEEEIRFAKDYYYLLNIRFGKAFNTFFDIDKNSSGYLLPPISIQILIENAVKHNVFDDEIPLDVYIEAKENKLTVKNKILKKPDNRESFKIGLDNIKRRYEVFTTKKITITKNTFFIVELPLLNTISNG